MEQIVIGSLERIGDGWEQGDISLSQVYMSGVICEGLVETYLPRYNVRRKDIPRMAIGVLLDHHSLGKRIVYSVLRAAGFEIIDFGQGLGPEEMAQMTVDNSVEILLISTLMLPSALKVSRVRDALIAKGSSARIIVGGAPFRLDPTLWQRVGADADGQSATGVVSVIEQLVRGGGH
jgi:methylmalonyl-CoA mutase cobalamin-binding domain/chain